MSIHCTRRGLNTLYIYKGNFLQSEVDPILKHVVVVCFVPISCPELANLPGWDTVRIHQYVHPLHQKGLQHFINIYKGNVLQSEVDPRLKHVVVVCFCTYLLPRISQSANLPGWDTIRTHKYVHPLHRKGLQHFIYIKEMYSSLKQILASNMLLWYVFVPICYPELANQPTSMVGIQ